MNILILSAGTRDKIVQFFRRELAGRGRVIATDCSELAPALYEADKAYIVPRIDAPDYIDRILAICKEEQIGGLFSLIDPELSLIAKNRTRFEAIGTVPVVSSFELCETSLDKYRMMETFTRFGLKTARCYLTLEDFRAAAAAGEVSLPVFVKPRLGSASLGINRVDDEELLAALMHTDPDLMIQELMRGQEYGADVYIDLLSGKCTHIFLKKKIKMRAGETDKSVSVRDPALFAEIARFAEGAGYRGMIDIDLFHVEEEGAPDHGTWYFSEVNPRFGGGYPHAYACGVNFPAAMLKNLAGREGTPAVGDYETGVCMMKFNETMIRSEKELCPSADSTGENA
ncbi:MAG: ATP-grasp domain-containing protein [Lachnospiraceae bacterium]|nr:ATP-grasp domain-containing protein [Lachnospiraceae bacterium]